MSKHSFEKFVRRAVEHELSPKEHEGHPDLDAFLAVLASDVPDETRGEVVAHVATCLPCQKKWREVEQTLSLRQARHEARAGSPRLAELVRERESAWELARAPRARRPVFRLGPVLRPVLVPALVSAAAVALTLGVGLPMLRRDGTAPSEQWIALTQEVEALRSATHTLTSALLQSGVTVPANTLRPEITADELSSLKDRAEQIRDPWQRALYVSSVLNRWGIEPSALHNWHSVEPYTVRSGDTWQTLAAQRLGDRGAWPVLWLLNSDAASPTANPPVGTSILLPLSTK